MIFALFSVSAACLFVWLIAIRVFPRMSIKWKVVLLFAPCVLGWSLVIGLFYYGSNWTPPGAKIIKPADVYPGK